MSRGMASSLAGGVRTFLFLCVASVLLLPQGLMALDKFKADNGDDLSLTTSWVGGSLPGAADVAVWSNGVSAANCSNTWSSGTFDWGCVRVVDPGTNVVVSFNVNNSKPAVRGIDMSQASQDLTFQITAASPWQLSLSGNLDVKAGRTATLISPVGTTPIQAGSLTITNLGTVTCLNQFVLFNNGAVENMTAGTLNLNGFLMGWGATTGTFNQAGGTVNIFSNSSMTVGSGCRYNLSGGTLVLSKNMTINSDGFINILNVTGGMLNQTSGVFQLGTVATNNPCRYIQSGNSVVTAATLRVDYTGDLTVSNGIFYALAWDQLASKAGATNHLLFAGGTTFLPAFPTTRGAGAYADVSFDGVVLVPLAATNGYMQGLDHAFLGTNGLTVNTTNLDITIAQNLEDYSGQTGKLVKAGSGMLTLSGTNTFSGAVVITNGTLCLTHAQCLSTNSSVWIWAGATNFLSFSGNNTIQSLYLDGALQTPGVYNAGKLPSYITGSGALLTLVGSPPRGTVICIR